MRGAPAIAISGVLSVAVELAKKGFIGLFKIVTFIYLYLFIENLSIK